MKSFSNLLVFAVIALFASVSIAHSDDILSEDIYGWWRVEAPLTDNPYVYSTGRIHFNEDEMTFEATCSYTHGVELKAQVSSALEYDEDSFTILQNQRSVTRSGNANCVAVLTAGAIEYDYEDENHMVIFNRHTGFQMDLVR